MPDFLVFGILTCILAVVSLGMYIEQTETGPAKLLAVYLLIFTPMFIWYISLDEKYVTNQHFISTSVGNINCVVIDDKIVNLNEKLNCFVEDGTKILVTEFKGGFYGPILDLGPNVRKFKIVECCDKSSPINIGNYTPEIKGV